jgi:alpha-glucosidase
VWADPKPDGTPPNNWLSIFGGSAWEWDTSRRQYYLHNFLASQPDLNFHNEKVRAALLDITRFWLDLGVDGFRLDTINFYFHSRTLKDNPPLPDSERNASIAPEVNPYNFQDHLYDKSQPENLGFLRDFRALLDDYSAAAVGEVGDAQRGLDIVAQYTSGGDKVHMCYTFDFLSAERPTARSVRDVLERFMAAAPDGWACWAFSNHDVVRHASRWHVGTEEQPQFLKLMAALLLSLRGSVCLYQGEELGLPEAEISFEDLQDPYGIRFWPKFKGRDGCRTPMVWSSNLANGGFSAAKPWLPVPASHLASAVNAQAGHAESLHEFYRAFLRLRGASPALVKGDLKFVDTSGNLLAFERSFESDRLLCLFNLGPLAVEHALKQGGEPIRIEGLGGRLDRDKIALRGWQGAILRLKPSRQGRG